MMAELAKAIHHHRSGDLQQAESSYKDVLQSHPDNSDALHLLGTVSYQRGANEGAVGLIRKAISKNDQIPAYHNSLGSVLTSQGKIDQAIESFHKAIQLKADFEQAHYNLGLAFRTKGQIDEAIHCFKKVIQFKPNFPDIHKLLGEMLVLIEKLDEAEQCFLKAVGSRPDDPDAHYHLGNLAFAQQKWEQAVECLQTAVSLKPDFPEALNNLGLTHKKLGNLQEAERSFHEALRIRDVFPEAMNNLGYTLHMIGRLEDAFQWISKALDNKPGYAGAHYNLGNLFLDRGVLDKSLESFKEAIRLDPDSADAHNNLGKVFTKQNRLASAERCFRHALKLKPDLAYAFNNLGTVLMEQGRLTEAQNSFTRALEIDPDFSVAHSSLLLSLNYDSSLDPTEIYHAHRTWEQKHTEPLYPALLTFRNKPDSSRKLRIGYVSPDLRRHSVSFFLEGILEAHERSFYEVTCYSDVAYPDDVTERIKTLSDRWRNIYRMTDKALYDLIRDDGIDILIDLAGHTGHNRLLVFSRKPAPILVSYLGYPNTTGLSMIDYRITDRFADPPALSDHIHTEQLFRLPGGFLCYRPPSWTPGIEEPPILEPKRVTFGSFNNLSKITLEVIALWAEILNTVPHARLIMKAKALSDKETCHRITNHFSRLGVTEDNIRLMGQVESPEDHFALYNEIDIGLDPFPYNGTTTTCEALWMGVPVIVLEGRHHVSRVGVSIMSSIGMMDLIAGTKRDYRNIAKSLAGDLFRLRKLKGDLRNIILQSGLVNATRFTRYLEDAYRKMWHRWCREKGKPLYAVSCR